MAKDPREAVSWWQKAAEQGVAMAQHNLGWALAKGRGIDANPEEAVAWYREAANQGYGPSLHALGLAHKNGEGVPVNRQAAEFWLQTGADLGDPGSVAALAQLKAEPDEKQMPAVAAVKPLTREDIEQALASGVPTVEIVADLKKRGYSGFVDARMMAALKEKGADEALLRELRQAVGPVVP